MLHAVSHRLPSIPRQINHAELTHVNSISHIFSVRIVRTVCNLYSLASFYSVASVNVKFDDVGM